MAGSRSPCPVQCKVDVQCAANSLLFQPGKVEYHYTGGLGFTLGENFQIDAAADIATSVRTGLLAAVVLRVPAGSLCGS